MNIAIIEDEGELKGVKIVITSLIQSKIYTADSQRSFEVEGIFNVKRVVRIFI